MGVDLSVIIPTHNRSADLFENLDALLPQCRDRPVEVIVVDSASNPEHAAKLGVLLQRDDVRLIRLDRPGVSIARNAGLGAARGAWLGFLDDDAVPQPDWVRSVLTQIGSGDDRVGVVAGRVLPRWPAPAGMRMFPLKALGGRARILLSILDDPGVYRSFPEPLGISANLLIRKAALDRIGGFPGDMGRIGTSLASGEECAVMDRIVQLGYESWVCGTICVEHKIYPDQLTWRWLARRAWHQGRFNQNKSRLQRTTLPTAAKCIASLPALLPLQLLAGSNADYLVRLFHNIGFASGAVIAAFRPPLAACRAYWVAVFVVRSD